MYYDLSRVLRLNITIPIPPGTPEEDVDDYKRQCAGRLLEKFGIVPERLNWTIQPGVQQDLSAYISQSRTDDLAKVLCAKIVFPMARARLGPDAR